jgi:hypothetical protein
LTILIPEKRFLGMADINQAPKIQNGGYKPEVAISEQPYMIDR